MLRPGEDLIKRWAVFKNLSIGINQFSLTQVVSKYGHIKLSKINEDGSEFSLLIDGKIL